LRVEHLEDALGRGNRLLQVRVDATELLRGPYIMNSAAMKPTNSAGRQPSRANLLAAVPERHREGDAADELHQRRQHGQSRSSPSCWCDRETPTRLELRGLALFAPNALTMRWP